MAFLRPNDILVLEKNTGKVDRIVNGKVLPQPVLDVAVANKIERGLLGIAVAPSLSSDGKNMSFYIIHRQEERQTEMSSLGWHLQKETWFTDTNLQMVN